MWINCIVAFAGLCWCVYALAGFAPAKPAERNDGLSVDQQFNCKLCGLPLHAFKTEHGRIWLCTSMACKIRRRRLPTSGEATKIFRERAKKYL